MLPLNRDTSPKHICGNRVCVHSDTRKTLERLCGLTDGAHPRLGRRATDNGHLVHAVVDKSVPLSRVFHRLETSLWVLPHSQMSVVWELLRGLASSNTSIIVR
jgi:hypothetical protein